MPSLEKRAQSFPFSSDGAYNRGMHARRLALAIAVLVAASTALPAAADPQGSHSDVRFDAHLDLGWYYNFGVGFRVDIPIVPGGIVDGADDDLRISPGAELFWFYRRNHDGFGVIPLVALQWNFYIDDWSVFPELGIAFWWGPDRDYYWRSFAAPFLGIGARYHFSARNALLMRINWPAGFQIGITF